MTKIRQEDLIQSVADALQFISYYHPADYIQRPGRGLCPRGVPRRPGRHGPDPGQLADVRRGPPPHLPGYRHGGRLPQGRHGGAIRGGLEPATGGGRGGAPGLYAPGQYPARLHGLRPHRGPQEHRGQHPRRGPCGTGPRRDLRGPPRGQGRRLGEQGPFAILNPSDSLVDWVLRTVPTLGAGWCPPGMLGIGIGGSAEKAMLLAKEALLEDIDIHELRARGPANRLEELRLELFEKVNALGIGAQGLGGLTTVLDVKIRDFPTHAASLPVAIIPNCAATRHAHFTLDGSGPVALDPPRLADWPADRLRRRRRGAAGEPRRHHPGGDRHLAARGAPAAVRQARSPGATPPTSAWWTCSTAARPCPRAWTSRTASSTTSARWTRWATRWSAPPAPRPPPAWTSSPSRCWPRPG